MTWSPIHDDLADVIYDWTNNPQDRKSLGDYDISSLTERILSEFEVKSK